MSITLLSIIDAADRSPIDANTVIAASAVSSENSHGCSLLPYTAGNIDCPAIDREASDS